LQRDERDPAVPAVMINGRVVRNSIDPGGEGDPLVLEQIDAGEAPGHRVDGQVLRIFGSSQPGINIVVDAIEVTLVEGAGRVLIALTHPLDEWAIVIGRRLAQCAHWVTLSAPAKWIDRATLRSRSRMVKIGRASCRERVECSVREGL